MFDAIGYFLSALRLARQPGMRRWVILPLTFNILLFIVLYGLAGSALAGWVAAVSAGWQLEGTFAFLNGVITASIWLLQLLVWLALLMLFASTFTIAVQLVAAPFMGLLAERIDQRLTGTPLPDESVAGMVVRTLRRELRKTWDWLWRTLLVLLVVLVVSLIPVVNVLASVIWFLWSGWLLGLQYVDYGADTRQVPFLSMKAAARRQRMLVLGFGCIVLAVTMVPLVNLVIMPVAVIAGVMIWHQALKQHLREPLQ
ncbi:MAG TPA: sulfate transporter CysZ [Xanthomonadales bacterium]|nr:sulfate transporter CysZ [Xanthomonadales bacterium]